MTRYGKKAGDHFIRRVRAFVRAYPSYPWDEAHQGRENAAIGLPRSVLESLVLGFQLEYATVGLYDVLWESDPEFPDELLIPDARARVWRHQLPQKYVVAECLKIPVEVVDTGTATEIRGLDEEVDFGHAVSGNESGVFIALVWDDGQHHILSIAGKRGGLPYAGIPFTPNGGAVRFSWGKGRMLVRCAV